MAGATDARGVSEFTGVAILIAMTVLVTASVGLAVLVTDSATSTGPPSANFTFEYFERSSSMLVTFSRGERIAAENLSLGTAENRATWAELGGSATNATDMVGPGASVQLSRRNAFGEPVRRQMTITVEYVGPNGTRSTLATWNGAG